MSIEIATKKDLNEIFERIITSNTEFLNEQHTHKYVKKEYALDKLDCKSRKLDLLRENREIEHTKIGREFQYLNSDLDLILEKNAIKRIEK